MSQRRNVSGDLLAEIASLRLRGESLPKITETINQMGIYRPARAKEFSTSTIRLYAREAGRQLRERIKLTERRSAAA